MANQTSAWARIRCSLDCGCTCHWVGARVYHVRFRDWWKYIPFVSVPRPPKYLGAGAGRSCMEVAPDWCVYGTVTTCLFIGLAMNCFLLAVAWRLRRARKAAGFPLIVALGLGDTLSGCFGLGMAVARVVMGYPAVFESVWACRLFGMVGYLNFNLCGLMISFLALERYLLVCHDYRISMRVVWGVIAVTGIVYTMPLVYESNEFTSDLTTNYCFPRESSPLVFIIDGLTNIPLLALGFSYVSIFIHHMRMANEFDSDYPRTVCRRAMFVLVLYFTCYSPKLFLTVSSIIWGPGEIPRIMHLIPPMGLSMVFTINPIIVLCLYNNFRVQALALLKIGQPTPATV